MKNQEVFQALKKKLAWLCTVTTGSVLTIILIGTWINSEQQWYRNKQRAFEENLITLSEYLKSNRIVSQKQLAEWEIKDKLIIHIKDNGIPLLFRGGWRTQTEREVLLNKLQEYALTDNIILGQPLLSVEEVKSKIYTIKGDQKESYFGAIFITAKEDTYRSLMLLKPIQEHTEERIQQRLLFVFFDVAGIAALFFISWWFVGKALKPVEESQRKQTEFIAAASHELRSPLTVIRANVQAIEFPAEVNDMTVFSHKQMDSLKHFVTGIKKESNRMTRLIDDMLLLASVDAKRWNLNWKQIDMDVILIDTYDTFTPYCKEKERNLRLKLGEQMLPKIWADEDRMKQILSILIHNAVNYTEKGDTISIFGYQNENYLVVEVEDHGKGIPDKQKEAIFDRFYRGDQSRNEKEHFGLGLSIAKELTEIQNGQISIKDTKGGGATFSIRFLYDKK